MDVLFFICLLICFQILKTALFTNKIMEQIRSKRSKTYYKKNVNKNLFKRYIFIGFKKYIISILYYGNIAYTFFMLFYSIFGLITIIIGNQSYIDLINVFAACVFFITFLLFYIATSKEKFERLNSSIIKILFIIANIIFIISCFYLVYIFISEFMVLLQKI